MPYDRIDLYAVLGLDPSATRQQVSHAYRTLLRRHHPDTRASRGSADAAASDRALQQVLAAYEVLSDPARRADYDLRRTPQPRRAARRPSDDQPPIQAGPVRWHPSR